MLTFALAELRDCGFEVMSRQARLSLSDGGFDGLALCGQVDLGVDVCPAQVHVAEPGTDDVDVHARIRLDVQLLHADKREWIDSARRWTRAAE